MDKFLCVKMTLTPYTPIEKSKNNASNISSLNSLIIIIFKVTTQVFLLFHSAKPLPQINFACTTPLYCLVLFSSIQLRSSMSSHPRSSSSSCSKKIIALLLKVFSRSLVSYCNVWQNEKHNIKKYGVLTSIFMTLIKKSLLVKKN